MRVPAGFVTAFIKSCEGRRLNAYQDSVGRWTIGYGHADETVHEGEEITDTEANSLLAQDINTAAYRVCNALGDHVAKLSDHQYGALVSLSFNVGTIGQTIPRLIEDNQLSSVPGVILQFDHGHVHGELVILAGLKNRRELEVQMWNCPDTQEGLSMTDVPPTPIVATPVPQFTVSLSDDDKTQLVSQVAAAVSTAVTTPQTPAAVAAETKPLWQSKTLWALVLSGVAAVASHFGHSLSADQQNAALNTIMDALQYVGLVGAVMGRLVASKPLA